MANPVDAFMRGFAVVDQLETNRQNRAFADEQQSRMRTLWQRKDEEFEREELQRVQKGRRDRFEALSIDVQDDIVRQGEAILKDQGEQAQAEHLNKYFGNDPDAEARVFNEVIKRMQIEDSSAGEHFALANGVDPAAGPLVDKKNPVASFGVAPSGMGLDGPHIFWEVNSSNGKQPLTDNRTSAGNDRVKFVEPTMSSMTGFFGPEFMSAKTPMMFRMREQLQAMSSSTPIGDPRTQKTNTTQAATTQAETAQTETTQVDTQVNETGVRGTPADITKSPGFVDPDSLTPEEQAEQFPGVNFDAFSPESVKENPDQGLLARIGEFFSDEYKQSRTAGAIRNVTTKVRNVDDAESLGEAVGLGGVASLPGQHLQNAFAELARDREVPGWVTTGSNFLRGLLGIEQGGEDKIPTAPNETPDNAPSRSEAMNDPDAAINKAEAPKSQSATIKAATSVGQASRSQRRVPFVYELYNAASLAQAGLITPEEFQRFARTGSMDEPLETTLFNMQDAIAVIQTDPSQGGAVAGVSFIGAPGSGADAQTDEERFELATKLLEDFFVDEDGKDQPGLVRRAVRVFDRAGDVLANAFNDGNPIPIDQNFANEFEEGLQLVRNYEDPRWIINPSRWFDGRKLADRSGLIGYLGVRYGITNPEEFDDFAFHFGIDFNEFAENQRWSEERKAAQIIEMERAYRQDKKKDGSRFTRKEIVNDLIDKAAKG